MKKLFLIFELAFVCVAAMGQKEYKQIRALLKANNGDGALQAVQNCEKQDKFKNDPELYNYGFDSYVKKNDVLNEKAYLKQQYDTAALFKSIYGIFQYAFKCDSLESVPNAKGKVKLRYRSKHEPILRKMYSNLNNGGQYFLLKKSFADAYSFFDLYENSSDNPMLKNGPSKKDSLRHIRAAYWATVCAFQLKDLDKFFKYNAKALMDTTYRSKEMELSTEMYSVRGDTVNVLNTLSTGVREYPMNTFFFTNILDYYNERGKYQQALAVTDSMLNYDPRSVLAQYGKGLIYLKMKRYDDCINVSKSVILSDSTYAEAYYNVGFSYYNKAVARDAEVTSDMKLSDLRNVKRDVDKLYREALPYLEHYRTMEPNNLARWGKPLYRIYLSLNIGDKFDEIDKLLSQSDNNSEKSATETKK